MGIELHVTMRVSVYAHVFQNYFSFGILGGLDFVGWLAVWV